MTFRLYNSKMLAADLASGQVTQRDSLKYMMLATALYVQAIYLAFWYGAYRDWGFVVELVSVFVISLVGVHKCYQANGGDQGEEFLARMAALAAPVGFNVMVVSLALGQLVFFASPYVLGTGALRDPDSVYRFIVFLMPIAFTCVYYWRLAHHMASVFFMRNSQVASKA
ncbi:MAG: hypothetical protein RL710_1547 [Pseudomonadota bacterium]|jgi:hypothetical protein